MKQAQWERLDFEIEVMLSRYQRIKTTEQTPQARLEQLDQEAVRLLTRYPEYLDADSIQVHLGRAERQRAE